MSEVSGHGWATIQDAAEHYSVSTKTIRRWISEGRVDARRFGARLIRVNLDSIADNARPLQFEGVRR